MAIYDTLGATYGRTRRPDPRIATQIHAALGNAADVINVGAGTGSYEPPQTVLAVEPSHVMLAQRPPQSAPAVGAVAERLPLRDNAADAVMAVLTVHHWTDLPAGIAELRRVARRRIVILTWDQEVFRRQFWLVRDYLPQAAAFDDTRAVPTDLLVTLLGGAHQKPVHVPHDCTDGFGAAYWRRPHAYLDPQVRAGISLFTQTGEDVLAPGLRVCSSRAIGTWPARTHA
ncbi:class I SAM-dependent methyltransferase [Streptomyces sp. NPDC055400]